MPWRLLHTKLKQQQWSRCQHVQPYEVVYRHSTMKTNTLLSSKYMSVDSIISYLRYLCLFGNSVAQHILCCLVVLFVFVLCTFCLSSSCVRFVCSFSGLSILISPSVFSIVYFHCFGDRSRDVYGIEKQYCNLNKQLQKWFNYVYLLVQIAYD